VPWPVCCLQVIPIWQNPHKFAQHKQAPALRSLAPAEREVLLLLGSDVSTTKGNTIIQENDRVSKLLLLLNLCWDRCMSEVCDETRPRRSVLVLA
jgi:hypothetical protein